MPEEFQVDAEGNQILDGEGQPIPVEAEPTNEGLKEGEEEINGVVYTLDTDGNYLLNGVPTLDKDRVPFYNRVRESGRKVDEGEQKILKMQEDYQTEVERLKNPGPAALGDDDVDENTGLTGRQLKALDARNKQFRDRDLAGRQEMTDAEAAVSNINQERFRVKQDPKYKDFLTNGAFLQEVETAVSRLRPSTARLMGIYEQAVKMTMGNHTSELMKVAEKKGYKAAKEQREILGEIELLPAGGPSEIGGVKVTPEMRKEAADKGITIKSLVEIQEYEKKLKKEAKEGK